MKRNIGLSLINSEVCIVDKEMIELNEELVRLLVAIINNTVGK